MLNGPLLGKILKFALPFAASSVLQQLFNSIDVAVVGRFASSEALAAVGSNTPVISLLINLFVGISIGANVIISNHIGQRDEDSIRNAVNTTNILAIISGIVLLVVGVLVARPILTAMGTPGNVIDLAVLYLRIYFLGIPFLMIYNFGSAILRSKGDTKRPLYCLVVAGIINTALNLFFVINLKMGVAGVAIATDIASAVSAAMIIFLLRKEEEPFKLQLKQLSTTRIELNKILKIGIPAGFQGMVFSFANVFVQSAINGYGSNAIAGSSAAQNFEYYCYFMIVGFNAAATTFIGQNYAAGNYKRCKKIFWICMVLGVLSCGILNQVFFLNGNFFLSIFSTDPEVLKYGLIRITIVLATQALAGSYEISGSAMRGMGHSALPAILTVFGSCLLRLAWIYLLCPVHPGFDFLMTAYPISWILTGIMVCTAYWWVQRKELNKRIPA